MISSQMRALRSYRQRLKARGMARFEVLGRSRDRELIREVARRLSRDDPDSAAVSGDAKADPCRTRSVVRRHSSCAASLPPRRRGSRSLPLSHARPVDRLVTRYLLDTHIISNATKPAPSVRLVSRMSQQADEDVYISSLTLAEIHRGILEKPAGKKRAALERRFDGPEGPQALFAGQILSFDEKPGLVWWRLMAEGTGRGRPRSARST